LREAAHVTSTFDFARPSDNNRFAQSLFHSSAMAVRASRW
jgi:hypothetical protein